MAFKPKRRLERPAPTQVVETYKCKVDYTLYSDKEEEVKVLRECEEKIAFTEGKIGELIEVRRQAIQQMRVILKEQGVFRKIMGQLGITKDMIYDVDLREKLYIKYDVPREKIQKLSTREVRSLNKYDLSNSVVQDMLEDKEEFKKVIQLKEKEKKGNLQQQREEKIKKLTQEKERLEERIKQIEEELEQLNYEVMD